MEIFPTGVGLFYSSTLVWLLTWFLRQSCKECVVKFRANKQTRVDTYTRAVATSTPRPTGTTCDIFVFGRDGMATWQHGLLLPALNNVRPFPAEELMEAMAVSEILRNVGPGQVRTSYIFC